MWREIVRNFFYQLARSDQAKREHRRADLIAAAFAYAAENLNVDPSPSGITSAVDAELAQEHVDWGYEAKWVRTGYYFFYPSGSEVAGAAPISRTVFDRLLPLEERRAQRPPDPPPVQERTIPDGTVFDFQRQPSPAARQFFAGELGAMDARALVSTDLLKLDEKVLRGFFAWQELAL